MKKSTRKNIENALVPRLDDIRLYVDENDDISCSYNELGLRVWLLPESYFTLVAGRSRISAPILNSLALSPLGRPRLIRAGESEEKDRYPNYPAWTGRNWPIGRGVISKVILDDLGVDDDDKPIRHIAKAEEPCPPWLMYYFSPRDYDRENWLRHRESKYLSRYGATIGHQLRPEGSEVPFGCVTAHVPRKSAFGENLEEISELVAVLEQESMDLSIAIEHAGYAMPLDLLV